MIYSNLSLNNHNTRNMVLVLWGLITHDLDIVRITLQSVVVM